MTTETRLTEEEALAIFESGEDFEAVPGDYTPLGLILLAREGRDRADALLSAAVKAGRDAHLSWEQIGVGLGVTKEGARKHYAPKMAELEAGTAARDARPEVHRVEGHSYRR